MLRFIFWVCAIITIVFSILPITFVLYIATGEHLPTQDELEYIVALVLTSFFLAVMCFLFKVPV